MSANTFTPSPSQWDAFVQAHPRAHFLQLSAWGEHKRAYGWDVERVALVDGAHFLMGAQILFRTLPLRLGTMAYLSMGPLTDSAHSSLAPRLWDAIHACARRHRAAFLKWEPGIFSRDDIPDCTTLGFRESFQTVQPPRTVLIDIDADEETILSRMNQGTRRKIRQSLKSGIRYFQGGAEEVRLFTDIMQLTGVRNEFGVHEPDYYALAYQLFVPDHAALFLAKHEGDSLAGIFVFAVGETAWYVYGASSNVKRNLMATYGIQWEAIRWARARGCKVYDLWGIPDEDESILETQFESRSDGLWGVYGFKRGWGGRVVRGLGAWDYVYNSLIYKAFRAAMQFRT